MIPFMGRPVRNAQPFAVIHDPQSSAKATITKAAPGVGRRIVITSITVGVTAAGTAPTAIAVSVNLINGASGGSDIRWTQRIGVQATAGYSRHVSVSGWWEMDANTAATLEFPVSGGTNTNQSVSMSGFIVDVEAV